LEHYSVGTDTDFAPGERNYINKEDREFKEKTPDPDAEPTIKKALKDVRNNTVQDSGNRTKFFSGAVRDIQDSKGRFDLIEPEMLFRLARHYEVGAIKYNDRNWEKGIPVSSNINSAFRHLAKYMQGWQDEDHLAAVIWNITCIMRFEKDNRIDLLDLPWQKGEDLND